MPTDVDDPDGNQWYLFFKSGTRLDAKWFHNKLRTRIDDNVGGVFCKRKSTSGIWNAGVYSYKSAYVANGIDNGDEKRITIGTELWYLSWVQWKGLPAKDLTNYSLRFGDDGTIAEAIDWVEGKPEYVFYSRLSAPLANPNVDIAKAKAIYDK